MTAYELWFVVLIASAAPPWLACGAGQAEPKPSRTSLEPPPPAPSSVAETNPAPTTEPARTTSAKSADELGKRFVDAANLGDLASVEALSTSACWQKECASFAHQAKEKFKVRAAGGVREQAGHAVLGAEVVCPGDKKCDFVNLLLEQNGDEWRVADITEDDRKASDWVPNPAADPLSGGTSGSETPVSPSTSGGTVADAGRVIAAMRQELRACYTRALKEDPAAHGKVQVKIKVGVNGAVESATVTPSGQLPASVAPCIKKRVLIAKFDPPEGGSANVAFPIVFAKN